MKKLLIGLLLLSSVAALADSLDKCAYDATTYVLETENAGLTKNQLEIKILNVVERDCLMREGTTMRLQLHNPLLAKGIKSAIVDFKKTHKPQEDIRDMISDLL